MSMEEELKKVTEARIKEFRKSRKSEAGFVLLQKERELSKKISATVYGGRK